MALPEESTPGPGSGCGRPERIRSRAVAFCVGFGPSRSMWARIIAPTAATMSRADVNSNAKRYLVKIKAASELTLVPPALAACRFAGVVSVNARPRVSATSKANAMPNSSAAQRYPRSTSMSESEESRPTSINTNRNKIMMAPV